MSVTKLYDICLNSICCNLYLNYKIITKYSFIIPEKIQIEIFEKSFKEKWILFYEDMKFFNKNICQLKHIDLRKTRIEKVQYFDFLNGQNLDNLFVNLDGNFRLVNKNFHIKVRNLVIDSSTYYYKSFLDIYEKLFNNCIVTSSIEIHTKYVPKEFILNILEKAKGTLKICDLRKTPFSYFELRRLCKILEFHPNLRELHLNLKQVSSKQLRSLLTLLKTFFLDLSLHLYSWDTDVNKYLNPLLKNEIIAKEVVLLPKNFLWLLYNRLYENEVDLDDISLKNDLSCILNLSRKKNRVYQSVESSVLHRKFQEQKKWKFKNLQSKTLKKQVIKHFN